MKRRFLVLTLNAAGVGVEAGLRRAVEVLEGLAT
jgi:hypothetical protein